MRIAHVTSNKIGHTPGTERQVVYLAIAQKARGSDVVIMIDSEGIFTEVCRHYGIPVMVIDGLGPGGPGLVPGENIVQGFIGSLKKFGADLIHCHTAPATHLGVAAANRMHIPCFIMGDRALPMTPEMARHFRFTTICLSRASYDEVKSKAPWLEAYYVPNGTMPASSTQKREAATFDNQISLMCAGELIHKKAIDIAVLAMAELRRRRGQDCPILNIYGDGDQRELLVEMTAVLELNDIVRFHGFKRGIMEDCPPTDILVMPSRYEVGPLVAMEAMSRGMPIVATDVGEVANMLPDRRYGRVVPTDSIVALADGIDSLLTDIADGHFNPDLLIERHRSQFTNEKMAERIEGVYNQVLLNSATMPGKTGNFGRTRLCPMSWRPLYGAGTTGDC